MAIISIAVITEETIGDILAIRYTVIARKRQFLIYSLIYLDKFLPYINMPLVKVITGIRLTKLKMLNNDIITWLLEEIYCITL